MIVLSVGNEFDMSCSFWGLRPQQAVPAALQALPGLKPAKINVILHAACLQNAHAATWPPGPANAYQFTE